MKKSLLTLALAVAASAGQAATVTVTFDNPIFNGSGYDAVHIKFPLADGNKTEYVAAGRFQGSASNLVGVDAAVFVDNVNDLFMYCYDIYEDIRAGQVVSYNVNFGGATARTLQFLEAVNTIMSGSGAYDPYAWLHPVNRNQGAAIQLGIWESRYETSPDWNLDDGSFQAWNLDAATTTYWTAFSQAIDGSALAQRYTMVLEAPNAQDMIAGDPPLAVPEPGSLALLGLALVGLAATRRRLAA